MFQTEALASRSSCVILRIALHILNDQCVVREATSRAVHPSDRNINIHSNGWLRERISQSASSYKHCGSGHCGTLRNFSVQR